MVGKIDLHIHSTASDGSYSPEEVVRKSAALGLTIIALADHDSTDGIAPAMAAALDFPRLTVVPAVEINTDVATGEAHVLGYFIDYKNGELQATLATLRHSRLERAQKMLAKLANLGIHIEWQRVQELAGDGSVGRPHLAKAMLEKGYIASFTEAFDKYIGRYGPAYVERAKISPAEAVALVLRCNGLPVLAHPLTVNDPESLISELKAAGLAGIEAYYNSYTAEEADRLVSLARKHDLITTAGTDFHGLGSAGEAMIGDIEVPEEVAERIITLTEQWQQGRRYEEAR
ncbi:MAG TPA: PHP domain-containing protein [Dehalococcoidia bacterium]|nr:PHP domain-containing protein [Dehalococcoidia bacterium]